MAKKDKKPGRMRQLWRIYKITAKNDPTSVWLALLGMLVAIGVGLLIGFVTSTPSSFSFWLWPITGTTTGILIAMIVMSRRAERNAYMQIEGQAGAVGAVLDSQIRRRWSATPTPIAVNAKTKEAVYRMIGPAGVVLIGEGPSQRVTQMLEDEGRKVQRAVPGVTIHKLRVNQDQGGIRLHALLKTVYKLKKALTRAETSAVLNRLSALGHSSTLPIPKGIDPNKVRAPKRKV